MSVEFLQSRSVDYYSVVYHSPQLPFPPVAGLFTGFSAQNVKFSKFHKISTKCRMAMVETAFESPNHILFIFDNYLSDSLN